MGKKIMSIMTCSGLALGLLVGTPAHAGDWSVSIWGGWPYWAEPVPVPVPAPIYPPPVTYYHQGPGVDDDYGYQTPGTGRGWDYYPSYRPWNPVERRDVYQDQQYAPDGTYHREQTVEDRHSSYYSPGRNEAITRPRTTVENWEAGPGRQGSRERTSWIGADGRPHSTTVERDTFRDPWGNSQTDTNVTLKRKPAQVAPGNPPTEGYLQPPRRQQAPLAEPPAPAPSAPWTGPEEPPAPIRAERSN